MTLSDSLILKIQESTNYLPKKYYLVTFNDCSYGPFDSKPQGITFSKDKLQASKVHFSINSAEQAVESGENDVETSVILLSGQEVVDQYDIDIPEIKSPKSVDF